MARPRIVDLQCFSAGAKGDVELGFAGVDPSDDHVILSHLRRSCLVFEPWLFRQPSGPDEEAVRDPAEPHPREGYDEVDPTDGRPVPDGHPGPGIAHATQAD